MLGIVGELGETRPDDFLFERSDRVAGRALLREDRLARGRVAAGQRDGRGRRGSGYGMRFCDSGRINMRYWRKNIEGELVRGS